METYKTPLARAVHSNIQMDLRLHLLSIADEYYNDTDPASLRRDIRALARAILSVDGSTANPGGLPASPDSLGD